MDSIISDSHARRERGFTLVELLIAIFIFAVVVSSVYGSYRATFNVIQGSESRLSMANSARVVIERLTEDLGSLALMVTDVSFQGERKDYSGNRGDSLTFASGAHLRLQKTDIVPGPVLISYLAEKDEDTGLLNLFRSEDVILPGTDTVGENERRHLICKGVRELRFTYYDQDGNEADEWQTAQGGVQGATPFPSRVLIEIILADSVESEAVTVFKTAVALPKLPAAQG